MVSVAKEDLTAIKLKNPRLIFLVGPKGSGKGTLSQRMVNEFKYSKIKVSDLIQKEIQKDTKFGQMAKDAYENGELVPDDVIVNILLHGLIETKNTSILIEGFPRTLAQAQYFEQNILPIKLIINFVVTQETCYKRLEELNKKKGLEINLEESKTKYEKLQSDLQPVLDFYTKYGIVRTVDSEKAIGSVYDQVKQNIYPVIYSIIGKRYAGKTELSKMLNSKMGIELIDFGDFLKEKEIAKRLKENEFVVASFIAKLRKMECPRVLIEDFPQNKEQYTYFVNNCKQIERIYYLNADDSSSLERLNALNKKDANYISCIQLNKMLYEFEQKSAFIDFLKKKANVMEIDVNNHKVLTIEKMINQIQPYCVIIKNSNENLAKNKNDIVDKLISKYKYEIIDIQKVIENGKNRNILIALNDNITIEDKIKLIQPILYRENCNKFILENFPMTLEELISFENSLCKINKLIYISNDNTLSMDKEDAIEVRFKKENKFILLSGQQEATDYQIEECLDMTRDINIVYGMPLSGKTTIAKHLVKSCGFASLDFKELIEVVKKTKVDPENPEAEPEITFQDLVQGLKNYLSNEPKEKRVVVDNFFIPTAPEPFLIDTYEKALEIIQTIGQFRNLYEIECKEETLINRYKKAQEIQEEISEDQKNAFNETLDKPKQLLEKIKSFSSNVIKVNTDENEEKSKSNFDASFGRNFIIIKHEYDINIEKYLELFACRNKLLYINVPKLIYSHFAQNDGDSKILEASYGKKSLKDECEDKTDFDRYIYYKYNPIHFERTLVNSLVLKYANSRYKEIENYGNFIILTGYLNNDLLNESDLPFNLPLYEIKSTMELGELTAFIQITRNDIKQIEDEEAVLLEEKPKKKPKKKEEGEGEGGEGEGEAEGEGEGEAEGEGEGEDAQQEEQNEEEDNPDGVPKFKPEGLSWTSYDGVPRNYVQVLNRLKKFPISLNETNLMSVNNEIERVLTLHLDKYATREQTHYEGMIEIIKV